MAADDNSALAGSIKGDFVMPESADLDEQVEPLPPQEDFWRPPTRFGSVPVEREPFGWDRRQRFLKLFPRVSLPFQVVERVSFGHPGLEPNRLFWGDNLHVMRQLPSESIDLIYIDPPFFSGRTYNVIFGDQNELRSFSDIWEGGMPGYLIWLNARLYEMKRLLKKTGSIYVHCDHHASHYIKVEMDKIFGYECFLNEIIWHYESGGRSSNFYPRKHDILLWYARNTSQKHFDGDAVGIPRNRCPQCGNEMSKWNNLKKNVDKDGRVYRTIKSAGKVYTYYDDEPTMPPDTWLGINHLQQKDPERIGYPTQKPERLLERVIAGTAPPGGMVADFFCGGGTTAAVAQRLGRSWVTCDQSRVAVALTADRLARQYDGQLTGIMPIPDFTIEHWGVYETGQLADMPQDEFRAFVLSCFGAVKAESEDSIHGMKGAVPVWVGDPDPRQSVQASEVQDFANAIRKTLRYQQDNLRDGIMLAWAFRQDALDAADRLRRLEQTDLNFVRLEQVRIDSDRFREHVAALSTQHADYENFLTFVQPPKVEVGYKRVGPHTVLFDLSETMVMNVGARIINVQWDFDYQGRFSSTPGYSYIGGATKAPSLRAEYAFPSSGVWHVACRVQDDMGGEGVWTAEVDVR